MTERGDAPPAERLERLRNSLMGTSTRARAERFATQGHTNVLIGASLHAADRLRQGKAVSDLERWLLDVLGAALPEQEIKDWGRVYREAVQALGERVAVVPPAISGRPVGTGFALTDLGLVLPAVGQEHAALPNTSIVDRDDRGRQKRRQPLVCAGAPLVRVRRHRLPAASARVERRSRHRGPVAARGKAGDRADVAGEAGVGKLPVQAGGGRPGGRQG
ncbi:hypothetical protein AB0M05_44860 [Streptomyces violaceusniger]|uniref:hypothetical protein n=1 Tax=Streptomyces violaceusniger TaxID=68280 RepID=UPI00342CE027